MGSRRNEPGPEDPWSVLGSEALKAHEAAGAAKRIQQVLDKHRPTNDTTAAPEAVPVVTAPTRPPNPQEAKKRLAEIFTDPEEALREAGEAAIRLEKSNPTP